MQCVITIEFNDASKTYNSQIDDLFVVFKFQTTRNVNKHGSIVPRWSYFSEARSYTLSPNISSLSDWKWRGKEREEMGKKTRSSFFWCLNSSISVALFFLSSLDASIAFKLSDKSHLVHYKWNSTDEALIKSVSVENAFASFVLTCDRWKWTKMKEKKNAHTNSPLNEISNLLAHERIRTNCRYDNAIALHVCCIVKIEWNEYQLCNQTHSTN